MKVPKQESSQSATNGANKNVKKTEFYINYQTDNKNSNGSRDHFLCNAHWAYKGCYLSLGEYQAYTFLQNPQKHYSNRLIAQNNQIARPLFAGVERTQAYSTTKKMRALIFRFSSPVLHQG